MLNLVETDQLEFLPVELQLEFLPVEFKILPDWSFYHDRYIALVGPPEDSRIARKKTSWKFKD